MKIDRIVTLAPALAVPAANWASKQYDAIVVGAGPAGIIGMVYFSHAVWDIVDSFISCKPYG